MAQVLTGVIPSVDVSACRDGPGRTVTKILTSVRKIPTYVAYRGSVSTTRGPIDVFVEKDCNLLRIPVKVSFSLTDDLPISKTYHIIKMIK